jgi:hypothetical protein
MSHSKSGMGCLSEEVLDAYLRKTTFSSHTEIVLTASQPTILRRRDLDDNIVHAPCVRPPMLGVASTSPQWNVLGGRGHRRLSEDNGAGQGYTQSSGLQLVGWPLTISHLAGGGVGWPRMVPSPLIPAKSQFSTHSATKPRIRAYISSYNPLFPPILTRRCLLPLPCQSQC